MMCLGTASRHNLCRGWLLYDSEGMPPGWPLRVLLAARGYFALGCAFSYAFRSAAVLTWV